MQTLSTWICLTSAAQAVTSDGARKRSALRYNSIGLRVPLAFFRREAKEIDALRAEREVRHRLNGEGSSSGTSGSSTSTALQALPPAEDYDGAAFESSVTPEDFVPDEALGSVMDQVLLCSAREAEERQVQVTRDEELEAMLLH